MDVDLHIDDGGAVSADIDVAEYVRDERPGRVIQILRLTWPALPMVGVKLPAFSSWWKS